MMEFWPFTNFHDLNLDWIIKTIKVYTKKVDDFIADITQVWNDFKDWTTDEINQMHDDFAEYVNVTEGALNTGAIANGAITKPKIDPDFLLEIENDYVTPEMFGAAGDGVTDDTTAVQDAFDSGKIVKGLGLYKVNRIDCNDPEYYVYNLRLTSDDNIPWSFNGCDLVVLYNCSVEDVTISGNNLIGIKLEDVDRFYADKLNINNLTSSSVCCGIEMNNVTDFGITNSIFESIAPVADADGIKVFGTTKNGYIKGCRFIDCEKRAIKLQTRNVTIENCYITGCQTARSIDCQYGGCVIESCYVVTSGQGALGVGSGCVVRNSYFETTDENGFFDTVISEPYSGISENIIIDNCIFNGDATRFFIDANNMTLKHVQITNTAMSLSHRLLRCTSIERLTWLNNTETTIGYINHDGTIDTLETYQTRDFIGFAWAHLIGRLGQASNNFLTSDGTTKHFYTASDPDNSGWAGLTNAAIGDMYTNTTNGNMFVYKTGGWTAL